MTSKLITNSLKFILILMLVYVLFAVLYSDAAQLTVPSDVRTQTMILNPQTPGCTPPCACAANEEGRIFYNNNDNKLYYCDGVNWKVLDPEKTVATKIVSAYNSSGATSDGINPCLGDGSTCNNPKADYTCDGTDDQEKINQAINSLPSVGGASYGVVYLLEGTYNISATVSPGETVAGIIPHSNTALIGTGKGTVLKVVSGASSLNVINASSVNRILISQLMIDGNSKTGTDNKGIYFYAVTSSKIDKLWVANMKLYGISLNNASSQNTISNNYVANSGSSGIHLDGASSNNTVSGNHIENDINDDSNGITLSAGECNYNIVSHNDIRNSGHAGIRVGSSKWNIISDNNIQNNFRHGIDLNSSYYTVVSNNNVEGVTYNGIDVYGSSYTTVSNNNVHHNGWHGIDVGGISNNVSGNMVYENGGSGTDACDGEPCSGIKLRSLAGFDKGHNIISSNRIYDSAGNGYGINIPPESLDNYLTGNLIDGLAYIDSATPPAYDRRIRDLGTGTKYTDKAKLTFERAPSQDPGADGMINATSTYIPLNPTSSYVLSSITAISDGNYSGGTLLILENINATNTITIPNGANTRLSIEGISGPIPLSGNDTLSLIWDGNGTAGVGDWVEIGYSDN